MRKGNKLVTSSARGLLVPMVALGSAVMLPQASAAATRIHVKVTCTVPAPEPERQLAPNSCLNYLQDGTQTYNATVTNYAGHPVAGVQVRWTDSSSTAHFRVANNPCTTNSKGVCSDELEEDKPTKGKKIKVTAAAAGSFGVGHLNFPAITHSPPVDKRPAHTVDARLLAATLILTALLEAWCGLSAW